MNFKCVQLKLESCAMACIRRDMLNVVWHACASNAGSVSHGVDAMA
jgi:hypothetical protein